MSRSNSVGDVLIPVAQIVPCTEAEGPGRRFALWFQGCPLRCPGCCNPEMLPFEGGEAMTLGEVGDLLRATAEEHVLEGITLLGGEPLAHAAAGTALARAAHALGLYVRELPETTRRWIGSSNQRIHFLSDRCDPNDPRWLQRNTLELRLRDGELSVNGFPARSAVGLWKRPRQHGGDVHVGDKQ
ncbi:MAG: 4Fe-4S cluster-binding domain-containing protein [Planctomycetes bacterium]|nr:4Fe-4S cluster-binding domain-containing protein [Planctomycetota bacterium]